MEALLNDAAHIVAIGIGQAAVATAIVRQLQVGR